MRYQVSLNDLLTCLVLMRARQIHRPPTVCKPSTESWERVPISLFEIGKRAGRTRERLGVQQERKLRQ